MANTFKNYTSRNIGTALEAVESYTVPSGTQTTVIGLTVANTLAATEVTVDVTLSGGGNDTYIVKGASVLPGTSLVVVGGEQKVVLETGDQIKVKSSNAASVDAVLSVLEIS